MYVIGSPGIRSTRLSVLTIASDEKGLSVAVSVEVTLVGLSAAVTMFESEPVADELTVPTIVKSIDADTGRETVSLIFPVPPDEVALAPFVFAPTDHASLVKSAGRKSVTTAFTASALVLATSTV